MTSRSTLRATRLTEIRRRVNAGDGVTIGELIERLGVSEATVRRDLTALERSGALHRTHGGAVARTPELFQEPPLHERSGINVRLKRAVARLAAAEVHPGDTIFLGGGSTTLWLAELLVATDVTVVTNSLAVAGRLASAPQVQVIVIGGTLRTPELSTIGPAAVAAIHSYRARTAFLGVPALSEQGFTADGDTEAATDTAFMAMAQRTVVVTDHTKLGRVSTTFVAPLAAIDTVITDARADARVVSGLRAAGTRVLLAEVAAR